jgi:hypothetical protein
MPLVPSKGPGRRATQSRAAQDHTQWRSSSPRQGPSPASRQQHAAANRNEPSTSRHCAHSHRTSTARHPQLRSAPSRRAAHAPARREAPPPHRGPTPRPTQRAQRVPASSSRVVPCRRHASWLGVAPRAARGRAPPAARALLIPCPGRLAPGFVPQAGRWAAGARSVVVPRRSASPRSRVGRGGRPMAPGRTGDRPTRPPTASSRATTASSPTCASPDMKKGDTLMVSPWGGWGLELRRRATARSRAR